MEKYNGQAIVKFDGSNGNAAVGVEVTVINNSTGAAAILYQDNDASGTTLANPLTTDSNGRYSFFAQNGNYTISFNSGDPSITVSLFDPSSRFTYTFNSVEKLKSGTLNTGVVENELKKVIDSGDISASTLGYYGTYSDSETPSGGANYILTTLARAKAEKGVGWVPDSGDHYLFSGTDYVAILDVSGYVSEDQFGGGALPNSIPGFLTSNGVALGVPYTPDLPRNKIEIVAGTVRQDGNNFVTITRSGSTATVSHVDHGYQTGDLLYIRKANQEEYNVSSVALTVVDADTYTYTVSGSPTTPATTTTNITASVPKYWDYILDSLHTPIGCDTTGRIEAAGSIIPVPFSKTYSKVISLVCNPDETLSNGLNMTAGASVGLSNINIKASINITLAAHVWYDGAAWQWSYGTGQGGTAPQNIEIESVTFPTNGNVEVKHSNCPGIDVQLSGFTNLGAVAPYIPLLRAASDSAVFINFQDTGGTIRSDSTPNTSHSFHLTKNFSEGIRMDGQGSFDFDLYEGNIWFLGIFQV